MRLRGLIVLAAALALAACNDGGLPPGGTYQSVQGVVVNAATNQPVSGATVTIDTVLTATTDANGKFSFAQVPIGELDYQVSATGAKYAPTTGTAHLAPDKPLTLDIALSTTP